MIRIGHLAPLLLIALPLAACSKTESASGNSFLSAMGVNASVPQAAVQSVAVVETAPEPVVEVVVPPPPQMVQVCWEESRRWGTYYETVCEMRPVSG